MDVLVISEGWGLFKPKSGGRSRFYNLAIQLMKKERRITVLQPSRYKESIDDSLAKVHYFRANFGNRTFGSITDLNIDFIIKFTKIIQKQKIDLIQISSPHGIISSKLVTKLLRKSIPVIYDAHNFESDIRKCILKDPKATFLEKIFTLTYAPLQERIAVKCADHIIAVSQEDRIRFIKKYSIIKQNITVIPSGVDIMELPTLKDKDEIKKELDIDKNNLVIIFHGSHFHPPNREAIDLIKNDIAPEIMKVDKDIVFVIAGFDVPVFEEENIKSVGYVADIYSLIHAADMAIVPILSGGGTKLKVLDYMGVGLPIVKTKKGIEGINAKNGEDAIIVGDVNAKFTDAIKYLIDNKQEREKIGANARKLAEEEYDWDKIGEKLDNLYREILEGKRHANN
jgi:glycosyltransferase involved in cell wall biosynthesis